MSKDTESKILFLLLKTKQRRLRGLLSLRKECIFNPSKRIKIYMSLRFLDIRIKETKEDLNDILERIAKQENLNDIINRVARKIK